MPYIQRSGWAQNPPAEADYYAIQTIVASRAPTDSRAENWRPATDGIAMEVSGIAILDDDRIAVAIRKGEVWMIDNAYTSDMTQLRFHLFASGLHEPLGLMRRGDHLLTAQRSELTELIDNDRDGQADEYRTMATGWGLTGHYHEYAYGPKLDGQGNLWITLNIGMGLNQQQLAQTVRHSRLGFRQGLWRGWGMMIDGQGNMHPMAAGMRSPSGLGANAAGDMFYTDQQGNWVPTNSLHHLRRGAFFHHVESLASAEQPGSPLNPKEAIPNGLPYPEALRRFPSMVPPAVWLPYKKAGQSSTDVMLDASGGAFGPFTGQLFIGEFTQAAINRVFLEKVDGQYQGACFPFRSGFDCAVLRLAQGRDGSVFAGLTNRGWSSLGNSAYGLQRLIWTGKTPFEILEMKAQPYGFELVFTAPVDPKSAGDVNSYKMESYTYLFHETYGSDEILKQPVTIDQVHVSADGMRVQLMVHNLRPLFVHELTAHGVRGRDQQTLLHPAAYYTLNRIPAK